MSRPQSWVRNHRLTIFFALAYVVAWAPWPLAAAGLLPRQFSFFPGAPLVAALLVIGIADGRPGYRLLASRLFRWRVGWIWYVVAIGFPVLLVVVTGYVTAWLGAPAPRFSGIAWGQVLVLFAIRLVDVTDGAAGEEPGWRGFALPHMQARWSPLVSAGLLGVLVAGWHVPLVVLGSLAPVGLPSTVVITFVYVWLVDRTQGSLLMPLLFHASQGALTFGMLGFTGTDADLVAVVYFGVLVVAVAAIIALDRPAWRTAPASAVNEDRAPARRAGHSATRSRSPFPPGARP
jgi:membrane protease YdiL (CAAX protease family)